MNVLSEQLVLSGGNKEIVPLPVTMALITDFESGEKRTCIKIINCFLITFYPSKLWKTSMIIQPWLVIQFHLFQASARRSHSAVRRHIQNAWNWSKIQIPHFPLEMRRLCLASNHYLGMMFFKWSCLRYTGNTLTQKSNLLPINTT